LALSALTWVVGCATAESQLNQAARDKAAAVEERSAFAVAEEAAKQPLPPLPDDCRRKEYSGVKIGERLDIALLKTDAALTRANSRVLRCAGFYDEVKASREPGAGD